MMSVESERKTPPNNVEVKVIKLLLARGVACKT